MTSPDTIAVAQQLAPKLTAWRRTIHAHPEMGFQEFGTAILVDSVRRLIS